MKRTFTLTFGFLVSILLIMSYSYVFTNINQPPVQRTGSPADNGKTCADAGCHAGGSGGAQVDAANAIKIKFGTSVNPNLNPFLSSALQWAPGTTYHINVNLQDLASAGASRYGFEMSALNSSNSQIGTFSENQATVSLQTFAGIQYVGHQNANTNLAWLFSWTSPSDTSQGPATFYVAANGANGNNAADAGDKIRYKSITISPVGSPIDTTGIFDIADNDIRFSMFPNPVQREFTIHYALQTNANVQMDIINLSGQEVQQITQSKKISGAHIETYEIDGALQPGIYLLRIQADEMVGYAKFLKN